MFDFFLRIFLFLSPIIILPVNGLAQRFQWFQFGYFSSSINLVQLQFFQYGIVFLFFIALMEKPRRFFQNKYLGLLFFVFMLSVYFHPKTIVDFVNILLGFLLYYLVVVYSKNTKNILIPFIVVSLLNTVFSALQFFDINLIYNSKVEIIGLMNYKTHLGIYQAISIPICYIFNPWLSIIPIIGLLLSNSFTAIISALVGLAYFFRKRISLIKSMPILMLAMSIALAFGGRIFYKLSLRFDVWLKTIEMIREKIFLGHGINVFKYIDINNTSFSDPYSLYFGLAYSLGMFGLIILTLFILNLFKRVEHIKGVGQALVASCLMLVVLGFGYNFMSYPRLAGTAIIMFALLTIYKKENYYYEN